MNVDSTIYTDVRGENTFIYDINENLPSYRFILIGDSLDNIIREIQIYVGGSTELLQKIEIYNEIEPPYRDANYFGRADFNFDGYYDIMLLSGWGVTGNENYLIWLFKIDSGVFVYNEQLSSFDLPEINPIKKEITSLYKGGYGYYHYYTYKYDNNKYNLISELEIFCDEKNEYAIRRESMIKNGKMEVISTKKILCGDFE